MDALGPSFLYVFGTALAVETLRAKVFSPYKLFDAVKSKIQHKTGIPPDDQRLIIRSDENELWVYDLASRQMEHRIDMPPSIYESYEDYWDEYY